MTAKPYNGHPSWNAWNVSLWIANDESLYSFALRCIDENPNLQVAARAFRDGIGVTRTPDGAKYTQTSVRHALAGLRD